MSAIVVGYVPDATGLFAVRQATREAQWRGAEIVLVNVVGAAGHTRPTAADDKDLDAIAAELTAQRVTFSIRHLDDPSAAHPADTILSVAAEVEAELIVVGIKRMSAVAKAVLGSTAQKVLLGASCPVLAVRASD